LEGEIIDFDGFGVSALIKFSNGIKFYFGISKLVLVKVGEKEKADFKSKLVELFKLNKNLKVLSGEPKILKQWVEDTSYKIYELEKLYQEKT
jgi:hypothetical protein